MLRVFLFCFSFYNVVFLIVFIFVFVFLFFFMCFMTSHKLNKIEKQLKPTAILSLKGHPRAPTRAAHPMQDLQVVDLCVQPSMINYPLCSN